MCSFSILHDLKHLRHEPQYRERQIPESQKLQGCRGGNIFWGANIKKSHIDQILNRQLGYLRIQKINCRTKRLLTLSPIGAAMTPQKVSRLLPTAVKKTEAMSSQTKSSAALRWRSGSARLCSHLSRSGKRLLVLRQVIGITHITPPQTLWVKSWLLFINCDSLLTAGGLELCLPLEPLSAARKSFATTVREYFTLSIFHYLAHLPLALLNIPSVCSTLPP